ncbi:hypothetical protein GCM10010260_38160 [Streptomyces filipinensis]|uniref:Uncharacterized protein n=1 Tax=Streptomyces filipinensis TaxID=66887 RepID=A0A918IBS1_9ACTN|nr:hypothetical protein GCM10010260_38160 [Streptomyces filipinensis]
MNVTVIRLTSLVFDTENGLAVHEREEVHVPNRGGALRAPAVRSAFHRIARLCVA